MAFPTSGVRTGYVGTEIIGDVLTKANFDKLPGGLVGYVSTTTASVAAGSTTTYIGATITAGTSRTYKISIGCTGAAQVGAGTSWITVANGTTGLNTNVVSLAAAANTPGAQCVALEQPAAGSTTYNFRQVTTATSIQVSAGAGAPAYLLVEDVGLNF